MKIKRIVPPLLFLCLPAWAAATGETDMTKNETLSRRERCIVPIAALAASGEVERLKPALAEGLDSGLTMNEIKEVLVHLYAYAGFPRSLNALAAFQTVVEDRKAKGIADLEGRGASPLPPDFDRDAYGAAVRAKLAGLEKDVSGAPWQKFTPAVDTFLKEHLFADLFARDVLSHSDRELATIAALANMTGTEGQLGFHLGAAMNTGLSRSQMEEFVAVLAAKVGEDVATRTKAILTGVLAKRDD